MNITSTSALTLTHINFYETSFNWRDYIGDIMVTRANTYVKQLNDEVDILKDAFYDVSLVLQDAATKIDFAYNQLTTIMNGVSY